MGDVISIKIDGKEVPNLHDYSVRFYWEQNRYQPTLYYCGRRVTQQFDIIVNYTIPKDPNGSSG